MDIKNLLSGIYDCECVRKHLCPIDIVDISDGAIDRLPSICKKYNNILLLSDVNTYRAAGEKAACALGGKIKTNLILGNEGELVIPNEVTIETIEKALTSDTDIIIGVGSGVINDLSKHVSFKNDLPYYIIATAPSMDGYASVGAALILDGMKITLNARPPRAIIAEPSILANAPFDMIKAGYGDIIGKFSCLGDWKLSALINGEYFCNEVYDLTYATAQRVKALADGIRERDPEAVAALMEALVTVGIAMSFVGNSRPASGSEHHISHFFEITGILDKKDYFAHGIDVVYSAVATARLREKMLKDTPKRRKFDRSEWEKSIRRIYSTSADGIIALQDKLGWYEKDDSAEVYSRWDEICKIMSEMPTSDEFIAMIDAVGLDFAEFEALYGKEKIADAILYAKDLKDRYTVLWLNYFYFEV